MLRLVLPHAGRDTAAVRPIWDGDTPSLPFWVSNFGL
jgi:hypothetical protein